jgi:hypothetical protein
LKYLVAYLVAAWTFLQFLDWTLNRYDISPYWVDLLLWIFIGLIPSVIVYFYHRERLNRLILKKQEKILFPLNILLILVTTYFGFGNTDLGATTKNISYTDELGNLQTKTITKEEFRITIPIFTFENVSANDSIDWWHHGIGKLLAADLEQNKSLSPYFQYLKDTSSKITEASIFSSFYVDGDFQKTNDSILINVYVRKANNAKILSERSFKGSNFLELIDAITVFITEEAGFVETNKIQYLDFPVSEFMSDSEAAIKEFINYDYDQAVAIDSTFALAYLEDAKKSMSFNVGSLEVQDAIDKAFKYRRKLPLQKQLEVNIQRNLAYGDYETAKNQVQLQLEVDPTNEFYNSVLYAIFGATRATEAYFDTSEQTFSKDPRPETGMNLAQAALVTGQEQMLINEIEKYELINPSMVAFKLPGYLYQNDLRNAEIVLNETKSLFPGWNNKLQVYESAIAYLKKKPFKPDQLDQFVGEYRSEYNEQTANLWVENDRIVVYIKNQDMKPMILGGENILVGGFVNDHTYSIRLVKDPDNKVIGIVFTQYNYRSSSKVWYWKEDQSILEAHKAFKAGDLDLAKTLYIKAIENNPKHGYLKNILSHINYVQSTPSDKLIKQHQDFAGNYGPRKFYVENDKFYYKRKSDSTQLPRVHLLAISENRYMDLTRYNTVMGFELDASGVMASSGYNYNAIDGKFEWEFFDQGLNYFLRED